MSDLLRHEINILKYILNSGGVSIAQFDEDHDPLGPKLRKRLMPDYIALDSSSILRLTPQGEEEIQ